MHHAFCLPSCQWISMDGVIPAGTRYCTEQQKFVSLWSLLSHHFMLPTPWLLSHHLLGTSSYTNLSSSSHDADFVKKGRHWCYTVNTSKGSWWWPCHKMLVLYTDFQLYYSVWWYQRRIHVSQTPNRILKECTTHDIFAIEHSSCVGRN